MHEHAASVILKSIVTTVTTENYYLDPGGRDGVASEVGIERDDCGVEHEGVG